LVGAATADDAGVYRLDARRALVVTVDFFTPIVDDPLLYGRIAATNALSDVYAMGGRPLTALNVLGVPPDRLPADTIAAILRGGAQQAIRARCVIAGGHTIQSPEPIYGLAVTGLVHPGRILTNAAARPGDWLVLTKPLGTGIVTTGIKRGLASPALVRRAVRVMSRLNDVGSELGERGWVRAGTDITGFGLIGHLAALGRASGVGAEVIASRVPVLGRRVWELVAQDCIPGGTRQNLSAAEAGTDWDEDVSDAWRHVLADAQTSGGLLLCVPERRLAQVLECLRQRRTLCAAVIGRILRAPAGRIRVRGTRADQPRTS
jgi:selenide,water dikinase